MDEQFSVKSRPPYKQAPADANERKNQQSYRMALIAEAKIHFAKPASGNLRMEIKYGRGRGAMDSANIIGGIADTLQGIAYLNDRQLVEVHYFEQKEGEDAYSIRISSLSNIRASA